MKNFVSELSPAQIVRRKKTVIGLWVATALAAVVLVVLCRVLGSYHWGTFAAGMTMMVLFFARMMVQDTLDPHLEKAHKEAVENFEYYTVPFAVTVIAGIAILLTGVLLNTYAGVSFGWMTAICGVGAAVAMSSLFVNEQVLKRAKAAAAAAA